MADGRDAARQDERQQELPLETPTQPARERRTRRAFEPWIDQTMPLAMPGEEWRQSHTWPWLFASSLGRIASIGKNRKHRPTVSRCGGAAKRDGYVVVRTHKTGGKSHFQRRHTIVADTWLGPRPKGMVLRHLDGTTTNDRPDNLAWGTHRQNSLDRFAHGTIVAAIDRATLIGLLLTMRQGETDRAAGKRLKIGKSTVNAVRTGRTWAHVAPCMPRRNARQQTQRATTTDVRRPP